MRSERPQDSSIIGESPAFLSVLEQVSKVAPLSRPVLIIGERGTGKELIASRLHFLSDRWDQSFVTLNCAALAESVLESELFGHEAGAFTGATKQRKGRFELANEGSLFLDELANTPQSVQEKILRVIEYGVFERVGGSQEVHTDTRIIAATNEDLPKLAEEGKFRADLLDRLAFDVITVPPLRCRIEDIMPLAEHFARRMSAELNRDLFAGFSQSAQDALCQYEWPGNVRELKNVVERAVYRNDDANDPINDIVFDPFDSPFRPSETDCANADGSSNSRRPSASRPLDFRETVAQIEIALIEEAMVACKHNQRKAAEHLGMTYHQLRGYLRKYELVGND